MKYNLDLIGITLLEMLLGIGAIFGGLSMIQDPSGISMFQQDLTNLIIVPDFFLPGLWLFFVFGIGTFLFLVGIWLKYRVGWLLGLLISIIELLWIVVQLILLSSVGFIIWQAIIPAIAIITLIFLMMNQNRKIYFNNGKYLLPKLGF